MGEFVRVVTVEEEHFVQTWMTLAAARDWRKRAAGEIRRSNSLLKVSFRQLTSYVTIIQNKVGGSQDSKSHGNERMNRSLPILFNLDH